MNWIDKLERKFGKFGIKNLMLYIVTANAAIFLLNIVDPEQTLYFKLALDPVMVMKGEVWRLITFILIPPDSSPFWIVLVLYFSFLIGSALEHEWGSFRFTLYYFMGIIGTIIAAFISGYPVTATYLNMSLFLAFAKVYPNYEILLFFVLPVKVKYLAWIDWAFIGLTVLNAPLSGKLAAIASVVNYFVFFGRDIIFHSKNRREAYFNRQEYRSQIPKKDYFHRCTVCGITENDNPDMEFRYCSSCEGHFEYCMEHLKNHEHMKKDVK